MSKVKHTKLPKREIAHFKRADWDSLNNDFHEVDWNSILLRDSNTERAYDDFISTFSDKCNRRIPKIKIKQSNQTPWYDSETYESCRKNTSKIGIGKITLSFQMLGVIILSYATRRKWIIYLVMKKTIILLRRSFGPILNPNLAQGGSPSLSITMKLLNLIL